MCSFTAIPRPAFGEITAEERSLRYLAKEPALGWRLLPLEQVPTQGLRR
jgi:hypothetical protein